MTDSVVLAIDPGPEQSAFCYLDARGYPTTFVKAENDCVLTVCGAGFSPLVIEEVASYGMPVGREVFGTVFWAGRFAQRACDHGRKFTLIPRLDVKLHLCHTARGVNDAVIRQALIDRFGPGKDRAIGTKKNPGPLYGMSGDCWQALALAITFWETRGKQSK